MLVIFPFETIIIIVLIV